MIDTKRCSKCKNEKPATTEYFRVDRKAKSGLRSWCIDCDRAHDKKRNQTPERKAWFVERESKPERIEYVAGYIQRDYVKAKARQHSKLRWHNDPEYRAMQKRSDAKRRKTEHNREYMRGYQKDWMKTPQGKRANKITISRRRARLLQAEGSHNSSDIVRILEDQNGRCAYCGIPVFDDYHVDHVQPLTQGGSNWPDNLAIACPECNASKNNRTPEQWEGVRGW